MLLALCVIALVTTQLARTCRRPFDAPLAVGRNRRADGGSHCFFRPSAPMTHRWILLSAGWLLVVLTVAQGFVVANLIAMFATCSRCPCWHCSPGNSAETAQGAGRRARGFCSEWVGVAVTFVAMSVVAMSSDTLARELVYELMAALGVTLCMDQLRDVPHRHALSITTKWGLFRYYWVAAKIVIAVGILVMAFGFLHDSLEHAGREAAALAATGGTAAQLSGVSDVVFWGFGCAMLSLIGALLLSLYKPSRRMRSLKNSSAPDDAAVQQRSPVSR